MESFHSHFFCGSGVLLVSCTFANGWLMNIEIRQANDGLLLENRALREELEQAQIAAYNKLIKERELIEACAALQNENRILRQQNKKAKEALSYI